MGKILNIKGQKYGFLTVESFVGRENNKTLWKCKCDCGNEIITTSNRLRLGETKSCGCYWKSHAYNKKYIDIELNLHRKYDNMMARCYNHKNSSYKNYGKRGIKVCDEWKKDINSFVEWGLNSGFKEGLTLDRIDVNGDYEPNNCKWSTRKEQNNNTRKNVYIKYNNEVKTLSQWAEKIGITGSALGARLKKMSIEQALTTPRLRKKNV